MMGKQSVLLTTDGDLHRIEEVLRSGGGVALLSDVASDDLKTLKPLEQLPIPISLAGKVSLVCYLAPTNLPAKVVIERDSQVKVHVNVGESHLIEFWRPFYDGQVVRQGRLYYTDRILQDGAFVMKDPAFCDWAKGVMTQIRKTLRRDSTRRTYVGVDATSAIEDGRIAVVSPFR